MKLYFLRHAEALDGTDDAARPLSPHGRKQAACIAEFLGAADVEFDAAYSSPLARARQTAEIVLDVCGGVAPAQLRSADALLNEASPMHFSRWLAELPSAKHILLAGHAPSLAERVRSLLSLSNAQVLKLPKAGLACVETEDCQTCVLRFLITPKVLGLRSD
jgi:phosphohistidine phosphatase